MVKMDEDYVTFNQLAKPLKRKVKHWLFSFNITNLEEVGDSAVTTIGSHRHRAVVEKAACVP